MKLEILGLLSSDTVINATFESRRDMDKFRQVFDQLYELFPPPIPAPPPVDNDHVAEGCEQFGGNQAVTAPSDADGKRPAPTGLLPNSVGSDLSDSRRF